MNEMTTAHTALIMAAHLIEQKIIKIERGKFNLPGTEMTSSSKPRGVIQFRCNSIEARGTIH